jgi:hypothetical protein
MFKAIARGLVDTGGKAWFTLTPLNEMWINDKFFPHHSLRKTLHEDHWAIEGLMEDNPHLSREAIEAFSRELTPEERLCRLYGKPLALSGLVYKEFDTEKHVLKEVPHGWENHFTPPKNYVISYAVDTHDQTPQAVLFIATSPFGQHFIFDEIWLRCTVDTLADEINRRVAGYTVGLRKCDPRAWINDPINGVSLAECLMQYGCYVEKAIKAPSFGILSVRKELLQPGRVYVNPHLDRFLFEIYRFCYDKENKPSDKDDHMMENLYRLMIKPPVWYDASSDDNVDTARRPLTRNLSPARGVRL